jgi:hypothetical protein
VRVALPTIDFDDDSRRAIRARLGSWGKATRAECVSFAEDAIGYALTAVEEEELEDELPGADLQLDGLERHHLQNPAAEPEDEDDEDDEIEGIPNADFEELEDDLRIVDHWI